MVAISIWFINKERNKFWKLVKAEIYGRHFYLVYGLGKKYVLKTRNREILISVI